MSSPARRVADAIAALVPNGQVLEHPIRDVSWEVRDNPREDSLARYHELRADVYGGQDDRARCDGVHVAVEGLCRIMVGGRSGGRGGGERFTGVVVHVIADEEPARTVLLPLE